MGDASTQPMDILRWIETARQREASLPVLGSAGRPYELVVPGWLEARAHEEGTTCQAIADAIFRYSVNVTVLAVDANTKIEETK